MRLTNQQVINYYEALNNLSESDITSRLPARVSYMIIKNIRELQPIVADALKIREKILTNNGSPQVDQEGNSYYSIDENKQEFVNKQLESLFSTENEVNISTFSLDTLNDCELSLQAMNALYFMVEG